MRPKVKLKSIVRNLDKFSPYPIFYPFLMSTNEKLMFDEAIKETRHYLEFGMGGSTLRAIQKSKAKIYSVESSPDWIEQMREYLVIKYFENKRLYIFPVDIGPTSDWGYSGTATDQNQFQAYSSKVFNLIHSKAIDLALVDGRFRVACTLKIILTCYENRNIKILIHDFWNREHYHIVLKYLNIERRADTLGLFSIKPNVDLESAKTDFEAYKLNPK